MPFALGYMYTYILRKKKSIWGLRDENRGEHFPAGKIARNRRNNIRAIVQTTGILGWNQWRIKGKNGRVENKVGAPAYFKRKR